MMKVMVGEGCWVFGFCGGEADDAIIFEAPTEHRLVSRFKNIKRKEGIWKKMGRGEDDQRGFCGEMKEGRNILQERHLVKIRCG